jgi:glycerol-3-phosphate acyltransferase PlsX
MYGTKNPTVALVSNGTEDRKGNEQTKAAFELLKTMPVNFVGNMEARDALSGKYDVLVADGFAGNILLKTMEGTAMKVMQMAGRFLQNNAAAGTDLSFVKKSFGELAALMDFNSNGGAPLLGVKKIMIKVHGSANASTVKSAVLQAYQMHEGKLIENLRKGVEAFNQNE